MYTHTCVSAIFSYVLHFTTHPLFHLCFPVCNTNINTNEIVQLRVGVYVCVHLFCHVSICRGGVYMSNSKLVNIRENTCMCVCVYLCEQVSKVNMVNL